MTRDQARQEADEAAADFARLTQQDSGTTGIPKPVEITVQQTETETERFGLDFEPQSTVTQGEGGGGPTEPPPEFHAYRIIISDPTITGFCEEYDCISYGGSATWSKHQAGVYATFDVNDDPNATNCGDECGMASNWDCSFYFEARKEHLTPNPCLGFACDPACYGGCCCEDYAQFSAGIDVIICNTGVVLADSWVDSDLESGLTLCDGDCSDPENGWCGWTTCWVFGDTWDEPYSKWLSWGSWADAVGVHNVSMHIDQTQLDWVYCGECTVENCWENYEDQGATFNSNTTLTFTVSVVQIA